MAISPTSTCKQFAVLLVLVGAVDRCLGDATGNFPEFAATIDQWQSVWNTTDCRDKIAIPAKCAELTKGFELDTQNGDEFFWAPEKGAGNEHTGCDPNGKPVHGDNPDCGQAVMRIYCHTEATLLLGVTGQANNGGQGAGNDDSFWWYFDGKYSGLFAAGWQQNSWKLGRIGGNGIHVMPGEHVLMLSEREDGTKARSITMLSGYPACHFGLPDPNRTANARLEAQLESFASTVGLRFDNVNNQTDLVRANVSILQSTQVDIQANVSTLQSLNTVLQTNVTDLQAENSRMKVSLSNMQDSIDNLQSSLVQVTNKLNSKVPDYSTGTPSTSGPKPASIEAVGSNMMIAAMQGKVTVNTATCSLDVCELGKQVQQLTSQINAEL